MILRNNPEEINDMNNPRMKIKMYTGTICRRIEKSRQ